MIRSNNWTILFTIYFISSSRTLFIECILTGFSTSKHMKIKLKQMCRLINIQKKNNTHLKMSPMVHIIILLLKKIWKL